MQEHGCFTAQGKGLLSSSAFLSPASLSIPLRTMPEVGPGSPEASSSCSYSVAMFLRVLHACEVSTVKKQKTHSQTQSFIMKI